MKEELRELLIEYKTHPNNEVVLLKIMSLAEKYDKLFETAKYLCALGTPIKPRKDFERAIRSALTDVQGALRAIILPNSPEEPPMTKENKQEANKLAKEFGIRPLWLSKEIE